MSCVVWYLIRCIHLFCQMWSGILSGVFRCLISVVLVLYQMCSGALPAVFTYFVMLFKFKCSDALPGVFTYFVMLLIYTV